MSSSEIIQKHPNLFGQPPFNPRETLIGFGFECSKYWLPTLANLFDELDTYVAEKYPQSEPPFRVQQVKEKFGSLCVYTNFSDDTIRDLIRKAEKEVSSICETCGKPGKLVNDKGWYTVACTTCLKRN